VENHSHLIPNRWGGVCRSHHLKFYGIFISHIFTSLLTLTTKRICKTETHTNHFFGNRTTVANMASYAISSSVILVIRDNIINGTNHIV
jgi:hypothetical protein